MEKDKSHNDGEAAGILSEMFAREMISARAAHDFPLPLPEPLKLDEYVGACRELLGKKEILPDSLLEERLAYLAQDGKLKAHLPEKCMCAPAIVPCSVFGNPLSEEEIEQGDVVAFEEDGELLDTAVPDVFHNLVVGHRRYRLKFPKKVTKGDYSLINLFHSNNSGFSSYFAKAAAVSGETFLSHSPSESVF